MAFEDENVIRAELKALRQSAVSMSVSQREGATQIVKDWLSDGANDSETEGEEELFLHNNKTGKKYAIMMREIE